MNENISKDGNRRGGWNANPPSVIRTKLKRLIFISPIPSYKIAGQLGLHPTRLSEMANGKREIPGNVLLQLCEFFECGEDDILGELDTPMFLESPVFRL